MTAGRFSVGVLVLLTLELALLVAAPGCGPRTVRLTLPELETLEQCVLEAEDQVDRQNCVERLKPRDAR